MRVISYSLFKNCPKQLFNYYLRGVYFNARMNSLLFPEWVTHVTIQKSIYNEYYYYFTRLKELFNIDYTIIDTDKIKRCEAMLWRLDHLFNNHDIEYLLCRDLDSVTTYRDKKSVDRWIESGAVAHGMNDNPAHGGMQLMGGMCGFRGELRKRVDNWEGIKTTIQLYEHGTDQQLLNSLIYPKVQDSFYFDREPLHYPFGGLSESDLVCRHIGSAGVVEMELIRFFERFAEDKEKFTKFEQKFKNIFYWWL